MGFLERLGAGERITPVETTRLRKDGSRIDVQLTISAIVERSEVVGALTIAQDLTGRREGEAALRRSEENYRQLFERHPAPMFVWDPATLRFLAVNETMVESYGWSRAEFLEMTLEQIWPEEDREALRASIAEASSTAVRAQQVRHVKRDGTVFPVGIAARAIDFDGVPARIVLARDVTVERRLEEELRQTQKMEAIGRLAGGIAHDFNNLLLVIRGNCHLLLPRLEGEAREYVTQIDAAAERASEFTRQLLAFSRQQVLRPEPLDLNAVVTDTLSLLERSLGEHVEIAADLAPGLDAVFVDRSELTKAILNLAINARDAMPDGGTLEIRTADVTMPDEATGQVPPGRYVLLQTTDSGVGMDLATRDHAFDPFFTTKQAGTGLGLATVYGLVTQSGGYIWLYSEPGMGTTFKLYFPVTSAAPTPAPTVEDAVESPVGDETILVVEDTEMVRDLVRATLTSYGYEVLAAANAEEALELAADESCRIDLLLTDVVMPGMNGRELADRLVAARPGLAVLFTSGYPADTVLRLEIADARANFIEKPYLPDELGRVVRRTLDRKPQR